VTKGEFKRFVDATGYLTEAEQGDGCFSFKTGKYEKDLSWRGSGVEQETTSPVACVSWNDAMDYINWLNEQTGKTYRLLTEAEWEYAARAGSEAAYTFGSDVKQLDAYAWYSGNSGGKAHPVGKKKPNRWGLYDMHGNIWEWVNDWYAEDYYKNSPQDNPTGPEKGVYRVLRGGSWFDNPTYVRSAGRSRGSPAYRLDGVGFRLARTP
jgi:formylglycine-generating enzyme required for sulfatase activity